MKRIAVVSMMALLGVVGFVPHATATTQDCLTIKGSEQGANAFAFYDSSGTLHFFMPLVAPACVPKVYKVYVWDATGTTSLTSKSLSGAPASTPGGDGAQTIGGQPGVGFNVAVPGAPQNICVSGTTGSDDRTIFDAGPDTWTNPPKAPGTSAGCASAAKQPPDTAPGVLPISF